MQDIGDSFENFVEVTKIGEGSTAFVYRARDPDLDRLVAIKIPKQLPYEDPVAFRRFFVEAKALTKLKHPNICSVFQIGERGSVPFIVMEFVPGRDLHWHISEGPLPTEQTILNEFIDLAAALEHAHQRNVIHRDIKPKNVVLTPTGGAVLTDFGLARLCDQEYTKTLTDLGQQLGTSHYMSPEQVKANGEPITAATDMYSLGALMFHRITGQPMYSGSPIRIMHFHLYEPPARLSSIRAEISPQLEAIVLRMLEKSVSRRFASMSEVREELESIASARQRKSSGNGRVELDRLFILMHEVHSMENATAILEAVSDDELSAGVQQLVEVLSKKRDGLDRLLNLAKQSMADQRRSELSSVAFKLCRLLQKRSVT